MNERIYATFLTLLGLGREQGGKEGGTMDDGVEGRKRKYTFNAQVKEVKIH